MPVLHFCLPFNKQQLFLRKRASRIWELLLASFKKPWAMPSNIRKALDNLSLSFSACESFNTFLIWGRSAIDGSSRTESKICTLLWLTGSLCVVCVFSY